MQLTFYLSGMRWRPLALKNFEQEQFSPLDFDCFRLCSRASSSQIFGLAVILDV